MRPSHLVGIERIYSFPGPRLEEVVYEKTNAVVAVAAMVDAIGWGSMHRLLFAAVGALLVLAIPAYAQNGNYPDSAEITARGLTPEDFPRWTEIEPNIYAYEDLHSPDGEGNIINTVSLIVVTSEGVVVVDGQETVEQSAALVDMVKSVTSQPTKYVVVASDHRDHVGGNEAFKEAFPDVVFISSFYSQRVMAGRPYPPTETVANKRTISMGGTEIQILNIGRGHTGGDLVAYLPQSKVLFMGELYLRDVFPAMRTGNPSEWINTIENAQSMDVSWYIPGHGFIDDQATMRSDLEEFRKALVHVVNEAKELYSAGAPCEMAKPEAGSDASCEAAQQADWGEYDDWAMRGSLEPFVIVRVYRELEGRLD